MDFCMCWNRHTFRIGNFRLCSLHLVRNPPLPNGFNVVFISYVCIYMWGKGVTNDLLLLLLLLLFLYHYICYD